MNIETIPNLPSAQLDPEDVDTKSEDHAFDALAYGSTIVLESFIEKPESKKGWREKLKEESYNSKIQSSWMAQ